MYLMPSLIPASQCTSHKPENEAREAIHCDDNDNGFGVKVEFSFITSPQDVWGRSVPENRRK